MKAKELLAQLFQLTEEELELEVYGYCAHGQTPEKACSPSVIYFGDDPSEGYANDEEEADANDYTAKGILL